MLLTSGRNWTLLASSIGRASVGIVERRKLRQVMEGILKRGGTHDTRRLEWAAVGRDQDVGWEHRDGAHPW